MKKKFKTVPFPTENAGDASDKEDDFTSNLNTVWNRRDARLSRTFLSVASFNLIISARHTLLVTGMGSVYSAGDGTDGALGLGGPQSSEAFRLVEW